MGTVDTFYDITPFVELVNSIMFLVIVAMIMYGVFILYRDVTSLRNLIDIPIAFRGQFAGVLLLRMSGSTVEGSVPHVWASLKSQTASFSRRNFNDISELMRRQAIESNPRYNNDIVY